MIHQTQEQKAMVGPYVAVLVTSVIRRSPTPDSLSGSDTTSRNKFSYIAPVIVISVGLTAILLLNIYFRRRSSQRVTPVNTLPANQQQSRETNTAKALLDTFPIVKFRGPHDSSLEMGDLAAVSRESRELRAPANQGPQPWETSEQNTTVDERDLAQVHRKTSNVSPTLTLAYATANVACSICTENFTDGQNVRMLPCGHQFHPRCIDPWLLNRSYTCSMCRIDLSRSVLV